jgi:cephalosporin hydroxylase
MSHRAISIGFAALAMILGILCIILYLDPARLVRHKQLEDQYVVDQFHKLYYDSQDTWRTAKWAGISTLQNPNDVWITQEIISEVKPDFIIEAGTRQAGSAALWAMVLQQVNPGGRVITIDIGDYVPKEARDLPIVKEKVDFLIGSSTDPKIVEDVRQRIGSGKTLVILDSDHHKPHVLRELESYGPMVSPGSYLIVQDTDINGHPVFPEYGPGPWEAVDAFLPKNPQFKPDKSRERFLFTMHPRGYLRRSE